MKKIIFFILLIVPNLIFSKTGYYMLSNHTLPVSKIREYSQKEILCFKNLIDSIIITDQETRTNKIQLINKTDSINFEKYSRFIEQYGYYTLNIEILKKYIFPTTRIINEYTTYDIKQKKWVTIHKRKIDTVDDRDFFLKNHTLQIHFSDRYAFDLMRLIEKSIYKKSCNEQDLMEYFVTYLWRKTEFKLYCFLGKYFHVALIPNMESCPFFKYYKYALYKYVEYCNSSDRNFAFALISDLSIDCNKKFNWDNITIKDKTTFASDNLIKRGIKFNKSMLEFIIRDTSPYKFQGGIYNVILCTHPNVHFSPSHN